MRVSGARWPSRLQRSVRTAEGETKRGGAVARVAKPGVRRAVLNKDLHKKSKRRQCPGEWPCADPPTMQPHAFAPLQPRGQARTMLAFAHGLTVMSVEKRPS